MSKERPNKDLQAFFERVFGLKFSYKRQKLTSKSLRIQDPKISSEDGTLNFDFREITKTMLWIKFKNLMKISMMNPLQP